MHNADFSPGYVHSRHLYIIHCQLRNSETQKLIAHVFSCTPVSIPRRSLIPLVRAYRPGTLIHHENWEFLCLALERALYCTQVSSYNVYVFRRVYIFWGIRRKHLQLL